MVETSRTDGKMEDLGIILGWNRANYLQSVMDRMPLFDSRESAFLHRQTVHLRVKLYLAWNTVPKRRRSCDASK